MSTAPPVLDVEREFSASTQDVVSETRFLIIDDVPVNARLVQAHLQNAGYAHFQLLNDATTAVDTIRENPPDIVLLDLMMPEVSGLEILDAIRNQLQQTYLPVIILTGTESRELHRQALQLGATDFLTKPVDAEELLPRVSNVLAAKSYQDRLAQEVSLRTRQFEEAQRDLIFCLARAAEFRDNDTGNHVLRVGCFAGIIAKAIGMNEHLVSLMQQAATLHDVGKIGTPDEILLKPGKLTPEEYEVIQRHCGFGKMICQPMSSKEFSDYMGHTRVGSKILEDCHSSLMNIAASIALTHHEWWDGSGYPLGLAGEDIPLEGRITAVVDVFDALSSRRPYKKAIPLNECFTILEDGRGTQFDPIVLDAFFANRDEIVSVQLAYADEC